VYFIFTAEVFFGFLAIIIALLIFPNRKQSSQDNYVYEREYDHGTSYSSDSDNGGGGSSD
jgi:hypothetical protein